MTDFEQQVVLVSGAARGMGASHVRGLVRAGAAVIAGDVLEPELESVVADLGDRAVAVRLDVTRVEDWQAAVTEAEHRFGPITGLVNNAAVLRPAPLEQIRLSDWQLTLDVNLTGVLLGMQAVIPSMRRAGGGSIVNISSTAGLQGFGNLGAYSASKWAVRGLTKTAALELGPSGIRVNSIHPGPIRTPMLTRTDDATAAAFPMGRVGEPEEVTRLVMFLLRDATYSTGHEFVIDGGTAAGQR